MSDPIASAPHDSTRTRTKTTTVVVSLAVALAVVIAAVWFLTLETTVSSAATDGEEIAIGLALEPTSLDVRENSGVATGQILIDNVYEGLVGIQAGTVDEIVPVLATGLPEVSADGLEYTFTLRDGVAFHSGAPLTVSDVVDSLSATLVPEVVGFAARVEPAGDRGVRILLEQPHSMLLWYLANTPGLILETGATNDPQRTANGTGPFEVDTWTRGNSITLTRNNAYWGELASVERAIFRFFPEGRSAVNALKDGEIDVHTSLLPSLRAEFENNAAFTMVRAESADVFTLAFNSAKAPFDDPRVRRALSMAIDSDELAASQHGDAIALGGPITSLEPGFEDLTDVNGYDPEAARELLAQAGRQNLSLTITVPDSYASSALDVITRQLADVGVSAKIHAVDFHSWLSEVYTNHDFDLSFVDHPEARDFANYANPDYYFGYDNPEVQRLTADALASTDPEAADELLRRAARLVVEDAPAKWLFNYTPTNVVSDRVTGFPEANTNSRVNLAGVTIRP